MRSGNLYGDWDKLEKALKKAGPLLDLNLQKATQYNAMHLRDQIKLRIRSGIDMAPLKPATIRRKRSSKPLIDYGDLLNSVTYHRLTALSFFIGVPRTARRRRAVQLAGGKGAVSRQDLVDIAKIHEFGAPQANIPARQYVRPGIRSAWPQMIAVWKKALEDTLHGKVFDAAKFKEGLSEG